mgnify:CR=1 FL=1
MGDRLAFSARGTGKNAKNEIWIYNLGNKTYEKIFESDQSIGQFEWTKDGMSLLYILQDKKTKVKKNKKITILTELYHKWDYWDRRTHLWIISINDKTKHRLTYGEWSVSSFALSNDGKRVAFIRSLPIEERPYSKQQFAILRLKGLKSKILGEYRFQGISNLKWSPDDKYIVFTAGASEVFKDVSVKDHNQYNSHLYIYNVNKKTYYKLTENFKPSIRGNILWDSISGNIYFTGLDKSTAEVFVVSPDTKNFRKVLLPVSSIYSYDKMRGKEKFLFTAAPMDRISQLYYYDCSTGNFKILIGNDADYKKEVVLSRYENFDFVNSDGRKIEGWFYYPLDFEPGKKYPMIVYYYGGVYPTTRNFNLYFNFLTANGYVVYTLNPVGAIGYGQEFADLHLNDWGTKAAEDIIEGVKKIVKAKPFIDGSKIGIYGGSYGGFMTMTLITKTDMFAAACSQYGISNIASYWGAGWWGFAYGDVALARSYPWNRQDVFVDKSPLYHADKIKTPLLLLHGTGDTNVPSEESDQMFTALKVLGKDVAYVRFAGENHGIRGFRKEVQLMMLEWYDKYLKGQPEAWNERWKK